MPAVSSRTSRRGFKPSRRRWLRLNLLAGLWLVVPLAHGAQGGPSPLAGVDDLPTLIVEGDSQFADVTEQLRSFNRARLAPAMALAGLDHPGPPIRVLLVEENSEAARRAPGWAAGYADGRAGVVVLMPRRVARYPDRTLFELVQHEVAHVLVARALGHGLDTELPPRWFGEGVAMAAGHAWSLEDRARMTLDMMGGGGGSLAEVDIAFSLGGRHTRGAYALSYAFVRDLRLRHGGDSPARILAAMRQGATFREAFSATTGEPLYAAEERFWSRSRLWNRWLPLFASSGVFWLPLSLLAVWAFRRRRVRTAEMMQRFEEEEQRLDPKP